MRLWLWWGLVKGEARFRVRAEVDVVRARVERRRESIFLCVERGLGGGR